MTDQLSNTASKVLNAPVNRRRLLQTLGAGAGLVLAWSAGPAGILKSYAVSAQEANKRETPTDVDSYLSVNKDGTVTLATGKVEFGQGIQTGFAQLVAEELGIDFDQVTVVMGITDRTPYDGATVGSGSTRRTGKIIRQAAAEMHQWLLELGADELGLTVDQVVAKGGAIVSASDATKSVTYATLATGEKTGRTASDTSPLKDPSTYTIVGQPLPRVDVPFKVNGAMKYGYDAVVDGMVHGKIVRPTAIGAKLLDIDFTDAEAMPGVVGTFRDGDFAGLAAKRRDQAEAALAAVKATWSEVNTGNTSENIYDLLRSTPDAGEVAEETPGDPDTALKTASKVVSATFHAPYVSHAPLEPKASLVQITPDRVDVWTSTQGPFQIQQAVADLLGRPLEQVFVTPLMSGGAFGSRSNAVAELEAAKLAQALDMPVRIQWTRQEEIMWGRFRPAAHIEIQAGLDDDGKISAWKYDLYAAAYYPEGSDNAISSSANAGANVFDVYDVANSKTTFFQCDTPLETAHWRGNGTSYNVFAYEGVIDQLAEVAGQDPVTFRKSLLTKNPRMAAVLDAAVEKAGWTPGVGSTGQGIGVALAFADETYVAEIARVAVDPDNGQLKVLHFDVAIDCGLVVNPAAATAQAEGSVIYSLSPAIREAIAFDNGKVTNDTWGQYKPISITEVPSIDVVFVEDKTQPMAGMGEPAVAPVPAAVANAIYDAVGVRLYEMPFTADRILAAIQAKNAATPTAG
jgi:isoquinoline 1-oxidoreductase